MCQRIVFKAFLVGVLGLLSMGMSTQAYSEPVVSREEFLQIQKLSKKVLSLFPRDKYLILGIGRSPTPLQAYFDVTEPGYFSTLPLSNFNHYHPGNEEHADPSLWELTVADKQKLFRHFDKFIPSEKSLAGRTLVTIDYSNQGSSVISSNQYISKYLEENGRRKQHIATIIADTQADYVLNNFREAGLTNLTMLVLKEESLVTQRIDRLWWKRFSKFRRYLIKESRAAVANKEGYSKILRSMRKHLGTPELNCQEYLAAPFPIQVKRILPERLR